MTRALLLGSLLGLSLAVSCASEPSEVDGDAQLNPTLPNPTPSGTETPPEEVDDSGRTDGSYIVDRIMGLGRGHLGHFFVVDLGTSNNPGRQLASYYNADAGGFGMEKLSIQFDLNVFNNYNCTQSYHWTALYRGEEWCETYEDAPYNQYVFTHSRDDGARDLIIVGNEGTRRSPGRWAYTSDLAINCSNPGNIQFTSVHHFVRDSTAFLGGVSDPINQARLFRCQLKRNDLYDNHFYYEIRVPVRRGGYECDALNLIVISPLRQNEIMDIFNGNQLYPEGQRIVDLVSGLVTFTPPGQGAPIWGSACY